MIPSLRYVLAFVVNVALPALAYQLALGHQYGLPGALLISGLPVLAWMILDLALFRHFDALSTLVLTSIALSLLVLVSKPGRWLLEASDPLVSGVIGALFLLSLAFERPLVFYLGRSTLSRERLGRENEFDLHWQTRPALVKSIRLMTLVWGLGLVSETAVRLTITTLVTDQSEQRLSTFVRYGFYGALLAWTFLYRRVYIQRQAQ